MKRFFASILCAGLIFTGSSLFAEEEKEVKYEVVIEVIYNALSINDAVAKVTETLNKHKDACNTKVKIKKVGSDDIYTTISAIGDIVYGGNN